MKAFCYIIFLSSFPFFAHSQAGEWTWMKGDSMPNNQGHYGVMGVPSPINEPPARYAPAFWTDTLGRFWIYGGCNHQSLFFNDLWMFDPVSLQWTWMKGDSVPMQQPVITSLIGVFSANNTPGYSGFGMFTWVRPDNHLWFYGGTGGDNFWQYNPAINEWANMGGSGGPPSYDTLGIGEVYTHPGERTESNVAWMDSTGDLWLYGGWGVISNNGGHFYDFADVWKYDLSTYLWTWMGGSAIAEDTGVYGTRGVPCDTCYPAARNTNFYWQDNDGNFWLGGGLTLHDTTWHQDIWKFNPYMRQWTWVYGLAAADNSMSQGSLCSLSDTTVCGRQYENRATWKVCDNLIITYGGNDYFSWHFALNDLWAYLPQQNRWLKIFAGNPNGNYGLRGISASTNCPMPKIGAAGFKDKHDNLWLFGGYVSYSNNNFEASNDLWRYVLDTSCVNISQCDIADVMCHLSSPQISAPYDTICGNDSVAICAPQGFYYYNWINNTLGNCTQAKNSGRYYVLVTDSTGCTTSSDSITIIKYPAININLLTVGDTLSVANIGSIQWYNNGITINGATQNIYIAHTFGNYTVSVTDTNGCTSFSSPVTITGIGNISDDESISIYPNPLSVGKWQLVVSSRLIGAIVEIFDDNGRVVFKTEIKNTHSEIPTQFAGGVYWLHINTGGSLITQRLVKL